MEALRHRHERPAGSCTCWGMSFVPWLNSSLTPCAITTRWHAFCRLTCDWGNNGRWSFQSSSFELWGGNSFYSLLSWVTCASCRLIEKTWAGVDFLHVDLLQHVPNLVARQFEVLLWDTPVPPMRAERSVQVYNHGNNFYMHLPIFILHMKDD